MLLETRPTGNHILDSLPESEREALGEFRQVSLRTAEVIHNPGEQLTHVYFPVTCVFSELTVMRDGASVEVSTTGREGFSPSLHTALRAMKAPTQTLCQVPGDTLCVSIDTFTRQMEKDGPLREFTESYARAVLVLMGQSIACNRLHTLTERCARWLLLTHDRVGEDAFPLTQEFLAIMLGVHRPAVSIAAGSLQQAGFIQYRRGHLRVIDRDGLETASCECYEVARGQLNGESRQT